MATTIQLEERIKHKLEEMKMHPRETYNRVIERLIETSDEEVLSPRTIKNIHFALQDVKSGRVHSTTEVRRKLGIR